MDMDYKRSSKCRMTLAKTPFYKDYHSFILPKKSRLKPIIDRKYCLIVILLPLKNVNVYLYFRLIQMFEGGFIKYWQRRIWPSLRQCDTNNQKSHGPRRLDLDSFKSPFLIWAIGLTLAFIAFLIENLVFIKNSK